MSFFTELLGSSPLASLAGALLTGSAKEAYLQDRQFDYQNDQMEASYRFGQAAQRNAASNNVEGLKQAGLSPALAAGSQFSPAQGPSPQSVGYGSAGSPSPLEILSAVGQARVAGAQANLMNSQAADIDFDIGERVGERFVLDTTAREFMTQAIKEGDKYSDAYRAILANSTAISGGSAKALRYWNQFLNERDNSQAQAIANSFVNEVYKNQKHNGAAKILADAPRRDVERFAMDLVKSNAEISNLLASADLSQARLREVAAHTYEMLTNANFQYHKDFAAMWKNKDYSAAAASLFSSALQNAASGAGFYFGAKGFQGRAAAGKLAPTTRKSFDQLYRTGFEGKRFGKKSSPLEGLSQSELNRRIMSYY